MFRTRIIRTDMGRLFGCETGRGKTGSGLFQLCVGWVGCGTSFPRTKRVRVKMGTVAISVGSVIGFHLRV